MTGHPFALVATIASVLWAVWYLFRPNPRAAAEDLLEEVPAPRVVDRTPRSGDDVGKDVTS